MAGPAEVVLAGKQLKIQELDRKRAELRGTASALAEGFQNYYKQVRIEKDIDLKEREMDINEADEERRKETYELNAQTAAEIRKITSAKAGLEYNIITGTASAEEYERATGLGIFDSKKVAEAKNASGEGGGAGPRDLQTAFGTISLLDANGKQFTAPVLRELQRQQALAYVDKYGMPPPGSMQAKAYNDFFPEPSTGPVKDYTDAMMTSFVEIATSKGIQFKPEELTNLAWLRENHPTEFKQASDTVNAQYRGAALDVKTKQLNFAASTLGTEENRTAFLADMSQLSERKAIEGAAELDLLINKAMVKDTTTELFMASIRAAIEVATDPFAPKEAQRLGQDILKSMIAAGEDGSPLSAKYARDQRISALRNLQAALQAKAEDLKVTLLTTFTPEQVTEFPRIKAYAQNLRSISGLIRQVEAGEGNFAPKKDKETAVEEK